MSQNRYYADKLRNQFFANIDARQNIQVVESDIDCDYSKYSSDVQPTDININTILHNNLADFCKNNSQFSADDMESLNSVQKSMLVLEQYDNLKQSLEQNTKNDADIKASKESQQESVKYTINNDDSGINAVSQSDTKHPRESKKHDTLPGRKMAEICAKNGEDAEEIVFNTLSADDAYSNINWVSCTDYRKGKGTANNDSRRYDIEYFHNGKQYCAEIKSVSGSGGKYEFFVSDNERSVAKEKMKDDRYVFILVLPNHEIQFVHTKKIKEILKLAEPESYKCTINI